MKIKKIVDAVKRDGMNSQLCTICAELNRQGYVVNVEGLVFEDDDIIIKVLNELELATNKFCIEIIKNNFKQKYDLTFTDYHVFCFENHLN